MHEGLVWLGLFTGELAAAPVFLNRRMVDASGVYSPTIMVKGGVRRVWLPAA